MQKMVRVQEDVDDCMRRNDEVCEHESVARLLDLRMAYPRVSKPALWGLLEKYRKNGKCLKSLPDLHKCTQYKVKGKGCMSEIIII